MNALNTFCTVSEGKDFVKLLVHIFSSVNEMIGDSNSDLDIDIA